MTPRPAGAAWIDVLGARPTDRRALIRALQARLDARGAACVHRPGLPAQSNAEGNGSPRLAQTPDATPAQATLVLCENRAVLAVATSPAAAPPELQAAVQAALARSTLVLLCAPSAGQDAATQALDSRLRALLTVSRTPFSVVQGPTAADQAWQALCLALGWSLGAESAPGPAQAARWQGPCDTCSDPGCEHRLFSDLLARRPPA